MNALLAAYRIGARVCWRGLSDVAVGADVPAATLGRFAELVFAYIDELSAASVAGHGDELATTGRARERYLQQLSDLLVAGSEEGVLSAAAGRAGGRRPSVLSGRGRRSGSPTAGRCGPGISHRPQRVSRSTPTSGLSSWSCARTRRPSAT